MHGSGFRTPVVSGLNVTGKRDLNELFASINQSPDAMMIIAGIQNTFRLLTSLMTKLDDPDAMRRARAESDDQIENLNKLLFNVFGNDKRLHIPVVHMISLPENAKDYIDTQYGKIDYGADNAAVAFPAFLFPVITMGPVFP